MKRKHLLMAVAALLAAVGLWFASPSERPPAFHESSMNDTAGEPRGPATAGPEMQDVPPKPGQMLRPPDPTQIFKDFTPEQRVEFARRGHGPGG